MAGPGPVTNRSAAEVDYSNANNTDAVVAQQAPATAPPADSSGATNSAEHYTGDWYAEPTYQRPPEDAAATSRAQLERDHAGLIADRSAIRDALAGPLKRMAKDDPSASRVLRSDSPGVGQFQNAVQSEAVAKALAHLPREAVKDLVMNDVRKAWPKLSQEDVEKTTNDLMRDIGAGMADRSAFALRDAAVQRLDATADKLDALSRNPSGLKDFTNNLRQLESGDKEQRAEAEELRASLGLKDVKLEDSSAVATALGKQANFLRDQGRELHGKSGIDLVMRTVKDLGLEDEVRAKAGIKDGSWADAALKQVKVKGEASQQTLDRMELALKATMIVALPVVGAEGAAAVIADMGMEALAQARHIGEKQERAAWVTAASASGIAHQGTAVEAQEEADHAVAVAAAEIGLSALAGGMAGHQAAHLGPEAAKMVGAKVTDEVAKRVAHRVGEVVGKTAVAVAASHAE